MEEYSSNSNLKFSKILFLFGDFDHLKYDRVTEEKNSKRQIFKKKRFKETIICGPFDKINTFGISIYFWNKEKKIPSKVSIFD